MKERVLIALSGGVDSSVAAALLLQEGYAVTAAYMKQWSDTEDLSGVCSWIEDRRDALRVAAKLGIELITLDFEKEYKEWVMGYMFKEYETGRTPNPDVMCNKFIKFGAWLEKAKELGFAYLATGHYARLRFASPGRPVLMMAKDENKDQTYFLHQLSEEQLEHTLFPIGDYTKEEVRALAKRFELPTANRAESMGICFVGEVPMKEFLQQKIPQTPGDIVTTDGKKIGTHEGLAFYTIGQRHGFGTSSDAPRYVVAKHKETNELVVGFEDDPLLQTKSIDVEQIHWICGQSPVLPLECEVRLRHRQPLQAATVAAASSGVRFTTATPQRAVTPGQFAVIYKDGECLGGGTIT